MQKLTDELTRINRTFWLNPLRQIINHYEGFTLNSEDAPEKQITRILTNLKQDEPQMDLNAILALEGLSCFEYRAYTMSNNRTLYWNPFEQPYSEFYAQYGEDAIEQYQFEQSYPSTDIIRRWFAEKFNYKKVLEARAIYESTIAQIG